MEKIRKTKIIPHIFMAALTLFITACEKNNDVKDTETWQCEESSAFIITMNIDKSALTAYCQIQKTSYGEQFELIFENGKSYNYSLVSDSIVIIAPLGEFLYKVITPQKIKLKYNGTLDTYRGTIGTYVFTKK